MEILTIIILIFSVLGAADRILGNRFGIGKEFEKAFMLLGTMALSMIGMIVISPLISDLMMPVADFFYETLHIDPSIIPASLFANDMGGAPLSVELAKNESVGSYCAMVVSSMMGCTISFTVPFALGMVGKENHRELLLGLLCGVVTIPIGCFTGGLVSGLPILTLLLTLMPIVIISAIVAFGLLKFPELCIKIFKGFGIFITAVITVGLCLGIINFLKGEEVIKGIATIEEGALICANASIVLSGSLPFMYILAKVLTKPFGAVGKKIGTNEIAVAGIISCIATSATTFGMMDKMDKKGVCMNSAFAVSGAFVIGGHLAFTMAFDQRYVFAVITGKLVAGVTALVLSHFIYNKMYK
ncbi:MAG: ethanolamine utilization protein EutH [Clostridia bacterium]|nr:ethanolamine utilization protein EutH [Clostridia bacterium]